MFMGFDPQQLRYPTTMMLAVPGTDCPVCEIQVHVLVLDCVSKRRHNQPVLTQTHLSWLTLDS